MIPNLSVPNIFRVPLKAVMAVWCEWDVKGFLERFFLPLRSK